MVGEDAPFKKITVGCIGVGWQGGGNLNSLLNENDCQVVAVCDVDEAHLQAAVDAVNGKYGNKDCKAYKDFRELIARDDIDAVAISTPDHWHAIIAITAAKAGKDIFCEKLLSHTLSEGIAMVDAVTRKNLIWQTGSWQRSQATFRWAAQLVQNGYLGKFTASDVQWIRDIQAREKQGDLKIQLYKSPVHFREFIDSIKSRKRTLTPVEIAHRSQTPGHLGYIASVTGRTLKWDAVKQEIIGDADATKLMQPRMRAPWTI